MRNTKRLSRSKTVDRANAYEVRLIDGQPAWALKFSHADNSNPYSRVKVSRGDDVIGHDRYVREWEEYPLIDNPLAATTPLTKDTIFPSTRELLEAGISCREPGGKGWAVYWMEGGAELTLFPRGEGPQEMSSIDELIEAIGGDQECVLTPASIKRFGTLEGIKTANVKYTQLEFTEFIHVSCCHE